MEPVANAFEPLLGRPAWLVRQGHGSFLTLEFGDPRLDIGGPRPLLFKTGKDTITVTTRRVEVRDWHLWIYCCRWTLTIDGRELAHCESDETTIRRTTSVLHGQELRRVDVASTDGSSEFLSTSAVSCPRGRRVV